MKILRRSYLTLIEMLIVLTILALVSGVVGINILRAVKEQRFQTEVDMMTNTFRLAQDLMLITNADVHVKMKAAPNQQGIEYWMEVEGGVPKEWEYLVPVRTKLLKEIHGVFFRDLQPFSIVQGEIDVRFQSGGAMMSKGLFRMSTHEDEQAQGAMVRAICLKGYPYPIVSLEEEEADACVVEEDTDFNTRLTSFTVQEIQEDILLQPARTAPEKEEETPPKEKT